eukprot:373888-Prorocentrum_lima.AAC.1
MSIVPPLNVCGTNSSSASVTKDTPYVREEILSKFLDAVMWDFKSICEHAQQVAVGGVCMVGCRNKNIAR